MFPEVGVFRAPVERRALAIARRDLIRVIFSCDVCGYLFEAPFRSHAYMGLHR